MSNRTAPSDLAPQSPIAESSSGVHPRPRFALQPARRSDKILGIVVGASIALLTIAIAWLLFAKNME